MGHSIDAALTTERTFSNRLWEKVYIAYYDRVKRYAFCILKRKSEAEDVAQNTFMRVRNHLDQADDDDHGKFSRYLLQMRCKIFKNCRSKSSRKKKRQSATSVCWSRN